MRLMIGKTKSGGKKQTPMTNITTYKCVYCYPYNTFLSKFQTIENTIQEFVYSFNKPIPQFIDVHILQV